MPEETWRNIERMRMLCCGKVVCPPCYSIIKKRQHAHIADFQRAEAADSSSAGELQQQMKLLEDSSKCPMCRHTFVSGDDQEIFQCVQSRAEQHGWDWAQENLGVYYLHGRGVTANAKEAVVWFQKASAQGNHRADFELGEIYNYGKGEVKRSPPEAARWYQKAADAGNALSQFSLGRMILIDRGEGVPMDTIKGARLLTLAAEQDEPAAQCLLANCYEQGRGVELSLDKAIYWNKKSADQGNVTAMYNYGVNLLDAAAAKYQGSQEVVGHSPIPETLYWVRKSIAAGLMEAKPLLEKLEKDMRARCANCKKVTLELQNCARCKAVMYCGAPCQKLHWKAGHKMDCVDGTGQKLVKYTTPST
jgi:TPR repeat protein